VDVVSKNLFTLASDGRFASQRTSNRRKYGVFVKILSWEKTFLMIWLDRKFFALPSKALRGFGNDFFEELGRAFTKLCRFWVWLTSIYLCITLFSLPNSHNVPQQVAKEVCHEETLFPFDFLFSSSFVLLRLQVFGI
jgi:hypothetical protein